jgi:hypothetical protein
MIRSIEVLARGVGLAGCLLAFEGSGTASGAQTCSGGGLLVSTIGVAGLAVFDIATAPASARRYNQGPVAIAPYMNPRDRSYGVSVTWFYRRPVPAVPRAVRVLPAVPSDSLRAHKSPGAAFALSFFSTAAPMGVGAAMNNGGGAGVFLAGVVVGPSVGQFYAGRPVRGLATAALRGAGALWFVSAIADCLFD